MEKCPVCAGYAWDGLEKHKCKPKWFCFDADDFKKDEVPTVEEFYSFGTSIFADSPSDAAVEYMKWIEQKYSDYFDEMDILILEKEDKIYKFTVNAETTRDYFVYGKPEVFDLKPNDTVGNLKLFDF